MNLHRPQHQHDSPTGQKGNTMNTNTNNTDSKKTFADLLTAWETVSTTPNTDTSAALVNLSKAVAYSVLAKTIDPQRKAAAERETVSNSGMNPALVSLRRGIAADFDTLDKIAAAGKAFAIKYTADGDPESVCIDADAAAADFDGLTLSDGIDLVQEAAAAILEETAKAFDRYELPAIIGDPNSRAAALGYMEKPYTVRRLKRKTVIHSTDSAAWETVETTPIQEVYRAVRRAIANSRAVQTDPRNGYSYIEELTADPESGALETLYIRLGKYADLGGYAVDANGAETHYTTDRQSLADYEATLAALNLSDRQATIISLRMRGYGYRAIASYLGVTPQAVNNAMAKVQAKAEKIGFTPAMWAEMTGKND